MKYTKIPAHLYFQQIAIAESQQQALVQKLLIEFPEIRIWEDSILFPTNVNPTKVREFILKNSS